MVSADFIRRFTEVAKAPSPDLAPAALAIARIEYPQLDASRYLQALDRMGAAAADRIASLGDDADLLRRIAEISAYLFKEQGFAGNRQHYDDPRNSFLNNVIDRRTGIPITLALVYIEVSRRAGLRIEGVNFPGHFLLGVHPDGPEAARGDGEQVIVDPFHGGTILSELDCRKLLRSHAGDEVPFDRRMLARATKPEIIVRMLVNLKRVYVRMRSFPQAHANHRAAPGPRPRGHDGAARPRAAVLPPERLCGRAERPGGVPAVLVAREGRRRRTERGRVERDERAQGDLGARQGAAEARSEPELVASPASVRRQLRFLRGGHRCETRRSFCSRPCSP